jgi:hypothetical protein
LIAVAGIEMVGAKGFEPSTSWSRIMGLENLTALSGVAYTENQQDFRSLKCPEVVPNFPSNVSSASPADLKREQTRRSQEAHIGNLGSSEPFWSNRRIARKQEFPPLARLSRNPAAVRVYDDLQDHA